jgi:RHS repeat-associated protein
VYDGMLLLQQRSGGNVPQVSYTRGPDLSGSLAGAGGIGGLLARSTHSSTSPYPLSTTAFYHADGNGNVTYLLRSDAGAHARYQYDPYGRTLSATGTLASANLLRFSSKPVVLSATGAWGCYYYGYRFYDPNTQRWLNRDPLGEAGGVNLYGFVWNNPTTYSDPDGQAPHAWVARGAFLVGSMIGDYLYDEFVDPMLDDYFATHVDPEVAANLNRARAALDAARAARNVGKLALNGAKLLKQCAAKSAGANLGRTGKQARLHELADDPNVSSADRGWIRQEQNSIARGQRDTIRNPPGKDLAHERGREAAKGYSYEHSNLQDRDLHRTQHKFDDFSRANAERPLRPDER